MHCGERQRTSRSFRYITLLTMAAGTMLWQNAESWAAQNVTVSPGQNLQQIVNEYPAGTTFTFTPGIYYYQSIVPLSNDTFVGESGAVLSGATLLTSFTQSGSYWTSPVSFATASSYPGVCGPNPNCTLPQDLFINNVLQTRVTSLSAVASGTWYYANGTAYIGSYPVGQTVELSVLPNAFSGSASNVTITSLTIEKYACVAGSGAVAANGGGAYWDIGHNEIRYNHGMGVQIGSGTYIHDDYIHSNGELGMGGQGTNATIQNNNISYNNYAGYTIYNEAGGAKFTNSSGITFQYNYVYQNMGPGFWVDMNSQSIICNANSFNNNEEAAVFIEISNGATVSNNYIVDDAYNPDGPYVWDGAAILNSNSANVSVYYNTVVDSMNGIVGLLANRGDAPNGQPYLIQNFNVNSNWVTQATGIAAGIYIEGTGFNNDVFTSWGNSILYNTWYLSNPNGDYFYWLNQEMSLAQLSSSI